MKIDFEFDSKYGVFRDAIYLPENHGLEESDIEQMKKDRFNSWCNSIENPVAAEIPDNDYQEINGEMYLKLQGVPPAGAKLIEIHGVWFYKV